MLVVQQLQTWHLDTLKGGPITLINNNEGTIFPPWVSFLTKTIQNIKGWIVENKVSQDWENVACV